MNSSLSYRYPGSSPFQDTEHDRCLFFGREEESRALIHLVLAENLVVLFAKSGTGKTSLLNAGVLQPLRDRRFIPLNIRFNDPERDPLQTVYQSIQDSFTLQRDELKGMEYVPGQETTLWEYFKTAEFWSAGNKLLTPVLVLDQFEDFFDFHADDRKQAFIRQFAALARGRILSARLEHSAEISPEDIAAETAPNVKIIIALREDYLGQLEEFAREIPAILHKRFRLTALTRKQAQDAIVKPAQVQTEHLKAASFQYAPQAIEAILDFLCKRKERDKEIMTDEVEPFQLQLLCQDIETKVQRQQQTIVQEDNLGGERGMQKVLQNFYDWQIKRIRWRKRRRVRKLCEKGLLSQSNRRLSLEEEDIERRFKVKKKMLNDLVNSRLLRAEPRVGSIYYELCHDTLVAPIRTSSKKYHARTRITRSIITVIIIVGGLFVAQAMLENYMIIRGLRVVLKFPEYLLAKGYNKIGDTLAWRNWKPEEAEIQYRKAIELYPDLVAPYSNLGFTLYNQGKYDEALFYLRRAIELHPTDAGSYEVIGHIFRTQEKYAEAIAQYREGLKLDSKMFWSYIGLGKALQMQGNYEEASAQYQKAIELDPKPASVYNELGAILAAQQKYDEAIASYRKALEIDPRDVNAYIGLGDAFKEQGKYDEAIVIYRKALEVDPKEVYTYNSLGYALSKQGKYDEAISQYQKALALDQNDATAKRHIVALYLLSGYVQEAMTLSQEILKSPQLDPDDTLAVPDDTLAMRFITITALFLQARRKEALTEIRELLKYYQGLSAEYQRGWRYGSFRSFLNTAEKLSDTDKTLFLKLIDILEAPKPEGDQKLKKLEAELGEMLKP